MESRQFYRLEEIEDALRNLGLQNFQSRILEDLSTGLLASYVEFPEFREGSTKIPLGVWREIEPDHRHSTDRLDFKFAVADFIQVEMALLQNVIKAIGLRDFDRINTTYREHFVKIKLLGDEIADDTWRGIADRCADYLTTLLSSSGEELRPKVRPEDYFEYIRAVQSELTRLVEPSPSKRNRGGRPANAYWEKIFEEALRRLLSGKNKLPVSGDMNEFAGHLAQWATKMLPASGREGPPKTATIADRLNRLRNENRKTD